MEWNSWEEAIADGFRGLVRGCTIPRTDRPEQRSGPWEALVQVDFDRADRCPGDTWDRVLLWVSIEQGGALYQARVSHN